VRIVISDDVLNVVVLSTFRCCVCMIELLIEATLSSPCYCMAKSPV